MTAIRGDLTEAGATTAIAVSESAMTYRYFLNWLCAAAASLLLVTPALANPTMLFDLESGRVITHQEAFKRWYPASLSKLMTAYVVFRAIDAGEVALDSPIRMTKKAAAEPPSKFGLKPGTVMRLDTALKIMLVKSANDVAMAIAENVGGSQKGFAERMNAEAARLGMTGSHFVNPHGLFSPEQYTTARDMALLARALRRDYPQYSPWFSIEGLAFGKKTIPNYNLLIGRYEGADGMKTGFVCASGFNLIGSATRNGRTLVAVVLGEQTAISRAEATARLLDAGFAVSPGATGATTISSLQPYGDTTTPNDVRDIVCRKKSPQEQSEGPPVAASDKPKSPFQEKLANPTLVAVKLGGATGPVPKAMRDAAGKAYADVPIPDWRPDLPPPAGFALSAQGDQASAN